jgi:ferric-dicitrate binding protein FerR (iron transport regulator)
MAEHPDKRYLELAEKWLLGTISPAEMQEYAKWYNEIDPEAVLEIPPQAAAGAEEYRLRLLKKINERRRRETAGIRRLYPFLPTGWAPRLGWPPRLGWAAAALLLLLGAGIYLKVGRAPQRPQGYASLRSKQTDLPPGGNKAILTLAGGKTIVLDSAANGTLARQGNSRVQKLNGRLSYVATRNDAVVQPTFNTLSTPKGGQYRLTLPDGTGIWLNAASSVTYPTAFVGKDRTVVVTGEAYFEVAQDKSRPFKVFIGSPKGMEVDVLGTHFNVNAYADEEVIKTTLLDGGIQVRRRGGGGGDNLSYLLFSPGQQAQAFPDGSLTMASNINTDEVMAWKNGLFQFDNADIRTVMRQLARWYNVDVSYEGKVTEDRFAGKLPMDASAEETLHILEKNQVHFRIENKKIIVMP